jgi:hypothetical protein
MAVGFAEEQVLKRNNNNYECSLYMPWTICLVLDWRMTMASL